MITGKKQPEILQPKLARDVLKSMEQARITHTIQPLTEGVFWLSAEHPQGPGWVFARNYDLGLEANLQLAAEAEAKGIKNGPNQRAFVCHQMYTKFAPLNGEVLGKYQNARGSHGLFRWFFDNDPKKSWDIWDIYTLRVDLPKQGDGRFEFEGVAYQESICEPDYTAEVIIRPERRDKKRKAEFRHAPSIGWYLPTDTLGESLNPFLRKRWYEKLLPISGTLSR